MLAGAAIISGLKSDRIHFQDHSRGCRQSCFLAGCWTKGLSFLLVHGQRPPSDLCHINLSTGLLTTWQLVSLRVSKWESEKGQARKPQTICDLISEVTSHPFSILFLRSSLGLAYTEGEGIMPGHKDQGMNIMGDNLGSCLPQMGSAVEASLRKGDIWIKTCSKWGKEPYLEEAHSRQREQNMQRSLVRRKAGIFSM